MICCWAGATATRNQRHLRLLPFCLQLRAALQATVAGIFLRHAPALRGSSALPQHFTPISTNNPPLHAQYLAYALAPAADRWFVAGGDMNVTQALRAGGHSRTTRLWYSFSSTSVAGT